MTDEEIRSRHAAQVAAIKDDMDRIERIRAAAPQMLKALKSALFHIDGACAPKTRAIVADAIEAAEGRER